MNQETKDACVEARKDIQKQFKEKGITLTAKIVDGWMKKMLDFKVSIEEAKRSTIIQLSKDNDVKVTTGNGGTTPEIKVHDLKNSQWADLRVTVKQLWDATSDSISQTGLIGDASGVIKFTVWANASIETILEEGGSYLLKNIVGNEYNGKVSATLNKTSSIEVLKDEVEIGSTEITVTGNLVKIKDNSGLIKRCPECNVALAKGACKEHGKVEGVYDLRIMAVIDDGTKPIDILLDRTATETLIGKTLDQCIEIAADKLDAGVIIEQFRKTLVGKYYRITGADFGQVMVTSCIQITEVNPDVTEELMKQAREMM